MRAAWYERHGSARETLIVGEMPHPVPGEGEVRIALTVSGLNPGDVKKRAGWQGSPMSYPRVVPHSDGAGMIDAVGPGANEARIGERVWCYGAQSYRPFGTAAEYVVVPEALAVTLPRTGGTDGPDDLDEQAACLGIAGITAHRAVFADGPVKGFVVLVHGAVGGVGSIATQLARRDGATGLAVVRDEGQLDRARVSARTTPSWPRPLTLSTASEPRHRLGFIASPRSTSRRISTSTARSSPPVG
jgi:NADPH2:quinone reductase